MKIWRTHVDLEAVSKDAHNRKIERAQFAKPSDTAVVFSIVPTQFHEIVTIFWVDEG